MSHRLRLLPPLTLCAIVLAQPMHAQVPASVLTLKRDSVVVPLDASAVRPTLTVTIRGKPYQFILDTGAGGSVIDKDLAQQLGLEVIGRSRVASPGGAPIEVDIVSAGTITIGDAEIANVTMRAFTLPANNTRTAGVLSYRAFAGSVISIDLQRSRLMLTREPLVERGAGVVSYALANNLIQIPATIGARTLSLDVDTGNPSTFTLPRALMDSIPLKRAAVRGPDAQLVSGPRQTWNAQIAGTVNIAGMQFQDPEVTFIDLDRANIGMGFIRQFVLSIDQAQRLIRFTRASSTGTTDKTGPSTSLACAQPGAGPDAIAAALIDAVNTGTYASIDSAVNRYWNVQRFPPAAIADIKQQLGRWHSLSTNLTARQTCATSPTTAFANVVNALTGETDSLFLALNPQTGKVFQWGIRAGAHIPITPADTATDEGRARALSSFVHRLAEAGAFSGEVLLAHNDRVLYHEAAGVSNRSTREPARMGQQYSIASVGKLITATAIMRLVEQGRLSLDDTIGKFLGASERPAAAGGVALKHILSHTDGMTRGADALAFKPGTQFSYVNYGYYLLGVIIERVTGKPFIDYYRTDVFAPAGMTHTTALDLKEPDPALPPAYTFAFDSTGPNFVVNREAQLTPATGAGGLFSTVDDLYRFVAALRSGRIVSRQALDIMRAPKTEFGASDYGYGIDWYLGDNIWGHIGHIPGVDAEIDLYGDSGYALIVLSNSEPNDTIRRRVTALVGRRPVCRSLAEDSCTPRVPSSGSGIQG